MVAVWQTQMIPLRIIYMCFCTKQGAGHTHMRHTQCIYGTCSTTYTTQMAAVWQTKWYLWWYNMCFCTEQCAGVVCGKNNPLVLWPRPSLWMCFLCVGKSFIWVYKAGVGTSYCVNHRASDCARHLAGIQTKCSTKPSTPPRPQPHPQWTHNIVMLLVVRITPLPHDQRPPPCGSAFLCNLASSMLGL